MQKTLDRIKELDKQINYTKPVCVHTNGKIFDLSIFRRQGNFVRSIYFDDISIEQAINKQRKMEYLRRDLKAYNPKN